MRFGQRLVLAVAVAGLLASSGCTSTAHVGAKASATTATTTSAAPSETPTPTSESVQPTPGATYLVPPPPSNVSVVANQYLSDTDLTNMTYRVELPSADQGPRQYAEGTAIMQGSEVVAYKVASGDIYDFICERFGLSNDGYILAVNQVRRGGNALLYAGDVLNLSPYTMHKYGSVNGKVLQNPDPNPMPPQQP